ncbi:hypothetical protein ABKN59_011974 [Abortiporus biennis]
MRVNFTTCDVTVHVNVTVEVPIIVDQCTYLQTSTYSTTFEVVLYKSTAYHLQFMKGDFIHCFTTQKSPCCIWRFQ